MSTRETYLALLAEGANSYWTVRAGPHLFPIQEEGGVWVCYRTHLEAVTAAVEVHHVDPHLVELVGIIRPDPSAVTPATSWKTDPSAPDPCSVPKPLGNFCSTCVHWGPQERWDAKAAGMRECVKIRRGWVIADDASRDVPRDNDAPMEWDAEKPSPADAYMAARAKALQDAKAAVWDGSEYTAELYTTGDFGCVLHEEGKFDGDPHA